MTHAPDAPPASLVALVPALAEALALLDDTHHVIISQKGSNRYMQFAAFGANLRGESVGDAYLEGAEMLSPEELAWLGGHGWNDPDVGGNYWRHWEPADFLAAATVAIVTLHMVHHVWYVGTLDLHSDDPEVLDVLTRGVV